MRLDKIRQHPKFQSLNPEDQATVIKNYINREWSKYETHKSYVLLPDEDKEKVRSGFMSRFYGDALKEQPFVDAKQPNPMFEGLTPAGPAKSVHAPVEYPEDPEREGKIDRTWGEAAKDTAIDAANSVIGLGEAGVGIADMASFNLVGKGLSKIGYDPAAAKGLLAQGYSDSRKQANTEVSEAKGFLGTVDALLDNPSVAFGAIVESSALTASGAAVARFAAVKLLGSALAKNGITAGSAAAKDFAAKFFLNPSVQSKIVMAGAGAEGAQTAGLIQEQGRQAGRDWSDTILPATAAGIGTAAIGGLTSKIPGLRDAEASLATAGLGGRIAAKQAVPNILKGTVKEGLEETLQSYNENALTNVALGRPWREGNAEAAGIGLVVGAGQGGAMMTGSSMLNLKRAVSVDILQAKNVDEAISKFQQGTGILQGAQNDILQKGGNPDITEAEATVDLERATGLLSPRTEIPLPKANEGNAERVNDLPAGPLSIIPSENKLYEKIVLPADEPVSDPIQGEPNGPVQNIGNQTTPKSAIPEGRVEVRQAAAEQVQPDNGTIAETGNAELQPSPVNPEGGTTNGENLDYTRTGEGTLPPYQRTTDNKGGKVYPNGENREAKRDLPTEPNEPTSTETKATESGNVGLSNVDIRAQESAEIKGSGQISPVEPTGKAVQESIPDKVESTKQDSTAQGTPPEASGIAPTTEATASAPSGGVVEIAKQVEKSLKYDGTNLGLHQFTAYDGPAKGATFSVKNPTQEEIQAGYDKVVKAFTKPTVKSVRQEIAELNAQIKSKPTPALKVELADAKVRLDYLKKSEYAAKKKSKAPKVTAKTKGAFSNGMKDGAMFGAIGKEEYTADQHASRAGIYKATERKAYIAGYNLGKTEQYIKTWKDNKDLLRAAIKNNDVNNVDFDVDFKGSTVDKFKEPVKQQPSKTPEQPVAAKEKVVVEPKSTKEPVKPIKADPVAPQSKPTAAQKKKITDNPNFRKWFGDSVVTVDGKAGSEPLVVYHGTKFFSSNIFGDFGNSKVFFFTDSSDYAGVYTGVGAQIDQNRKAKSFDSPQIIPVYLSAKKPIDLTEYGEAEKEVNIGYMLKKFDVSPKDYFRSLQFKKPTNAEIEEYQEQANGMIAPFFAIVKNNGFINKFKNTGYDSIILNEQGAKSIAVFNSTQIKSIFNKGSFSPTNPDILDNLSGSDTAKIQKIKQSRPHIDEVEFDTISAAVLSDNIKDILTTRAARAILSDMVSEGLASSELLGKFDSAKVKADFNEQARRLVKKRTDKELENIDVADLELLEDLTDFLKEYGPKKVKDAIAKEEKKLAELAKPKLISSHKNYTLSESIVGEKWKVSKNSPVPWQPTDKIHIVAIDEAEGPKKKKIEEVQRVVEAAVPRISEEVKAVRFILPDGTEYTVLNNKTALRSFKKLVSRIYTPAPAIRKSSTNVNPTNKAKKTFDWAEKTITHGEWVSDSTMAVRGFKPPNRPTEENSSFDTALVSYQQMAEKANPAEIRYYTSGETDTVVAKGPVLQMGELNAQAIIMDTITNKRFNVSQGKLNIVESIYPDVEYRISPDGVVFGYNEGEFIAAVMPAQGEPMNADKAKSYGLYSMGEFSDTPVIMEMPELVELATELMNGNRPLLVDKFRKAGVKGQFMPSGLGGIKILKELGADFHQALKTMAHEIGHLIDYKDADTMARGNILGRIASIKGYLKHYIEEKPGAPGVITEADRKRLMKEARLLTKREASELIDEVITTETPVTPEQVLAVLKGMETDPEPTADVISFIFTASTAVKKSIGLQAMKGLSPAEMAHLKTYIEVKTGNQMEQPKPTNKDVYNKFKELVKEEISKRNLISKEVITEELKLFTQLWKPFNVWGNAKYTKYRFSSEELYADALSGILVNPQMVQRVAPEFYKGFFNYIDNKPEASEIWGDIAKRIGRGPVEVSRARIQSDYEMLQRGEGVRAELAKIDDSQGFIDTLAENLSDKHHFINKALKQSTDKTKATAAINELKELPYIPSEVDAYLFEINGLQKEMDDNNLTVHDLDVVALRKHIAANRKDVFSTKGYTPETAAKDLGVLKADWGAEKYDMVNALLDKFRSIRDKRIYPLMEESGLYSDELVKFMNETTDYTKVSVTHHLNKKFGEGAGGRVYKALGTLSEVNSPVTATIIQDISLIRAARINKSKRSILPLLQEVGELKPASVKFNGKFMVAAESSEANEKIFTVMINGNAENYYVSQHIAEAYESDPYTANQVSEAWQMISSFTRQLFISKNPAWMAKNATRDFFGTVTKNKEIGLRHIPGLLLTYLKATPEAFNEAWKRKRSDTVDWLMTNRALTEDRVYDGRDISTDGELHRLQANYKLSTKADQNVGKWRKAWTGLNRNVDNVGRSMEIVSKIAGAQYLLKRGLSKQEVLNRVRNGRIGTPNFKERGKLHKYTNSIAMFSNVAVQGIKSHIEAIKESPADYIWKTMALNVVPTVMMFLAAKGVYDDGEDDGTITGGGYIKRIYAGIPEYNMSHYTCIPLFLTKDGKSVWLQIPRDYEGQTFGAIAWKMMKGKFVGKGTALSEAYNFFPYQLHPVPASALYVRDVYVKGINPVDDYMGRNKNSDAAMDLGGLMLAEEVVKNVWRDTGGGTLYKPEYDDIKRERSTAEIVLNLWGVNAIGAYIQISDRGVTEKIYDEFRAIDLEKTKQNVAIDKSLSKMTQEEKMVVAGIAPKLKDRIVKQGLLAKNTAFTKALAGATSKEKVAIVMREIANDMNRKDNDNIE
jgi:hypothetical protein